MSIVRNISCNPPAKKPRGANPKRPTQAQSIQRQKQIVFDHDVAHMTFAAIAKKYKMGEKEVRESYNRYLTEILPLFIDRTPTKAVQYLRDLEEIDQQLKLLIDHADNDSARVGALRLRKDLIFDVIKLRQNLGLLPMHIGDMRLIENQRWVAEQLAVVLQRLGAGPETFREIAAMLRVGPPAPVATARSATAAGEAAA